MACSSDSSSAALLLLPRELISLARSARADMENSSASAGSHLEACSQAKVALCVRLCVRKMDASKAPWECFENLMRSMSSRGALPHALMAAFQQTSSGRMLRPRSVWSSLTLPSSVRRGGGGGGPVASWHYLACIDDSIGSLKLGETISPRHVSADCHSLAFLGLPICANPSKPVKHRPSVSEALIIPLKLTMSGRAWSRVQLSPSLQSIPKPRGEYRARAVEGRVSASLVQIAQLTRAS